MGTFRIQLGHFTNYLFGVYLITKELVQAVGLLFSRKVKEPCVQAPQIEVRELLLSFRAESFVFQFAI
jgi:hypothetical protein